MNMRVDPIAVDPVNVGPIDAGPITAATFDVATLDVKAAASLSPNSRSVVEEYLSAPYQEIIGGIVELHRMRQGVIKAQKALVQQAQAQIRRCLVRASDLADAESKERARKLTANVYAEAVKDPAHEHHLRILPYLLAAEPVVDHRANYEREMVRLAKKLPVYPWVKGVKGLGDISSATLVGEAGDIGKYRDHSALWKRLGLAVIAGRRQGDPGQAASKEDWIVHAYNKQRRSVSYIAREHVIGGMGKWRPTFGEDVNANPDLTEYQRIFAERARREAVTLDLPVTESASGKESYKKHVSMRAHRYVEKRMVRDLYRAWRQARA